jgi:hypothetical protein
MRASTHAAFEERGRACLVADLLQDCTRKAAHPLLEYNRRWRLFQRGPRGGLSWPQQTHSLKLKAESKHDSCALPAATSLPAMSTGSPVRALVARAPTSPTALLLSTTTATTRHAVVFVQIEVPHPSVCMCALLPQVTILHQHAATLHKKHQAKHTQHNTTEHL